MVAFLAPAEFDVEAAALPRLVVDACCLRTGGFDFAGTDFGVSSFVATTFCVTLEAAGFTFCVVVDNDFFRLVGFWEGAAAFCFG